MKKTFKNFMLIFFNVIKEEKLGAGGCIMKNYRNKKGSSGVLAYDIGADFIRIKFIDGSIYRYTEASTGRDNLKKMMLLAEQGEGLSTFISQSIKDNFAEKE